MSYYEIEKALLPVWRGNTVYNESFMFVPDPLTGEMEPGRLLYEPKEIISMHSADFMVEYVQGKDYEVVGNRILRIPGGSMPCFSEEEYFLKEPASISIESVCRPGRYVRYEPGGVEYLKRQIAVTYTHGGTWQGPMPCFQGDLLARTTGRLRKKEPLTLLFYGDSVIEGCDASGRSGVAPYLPPLDMLVAVRLSGHFQNGNIRLVNTAVGGMDSLWGRENARRLVADKEPGLVVIGFGMNDGSRQISVRDYISNIQEIVDITRAKNSDAGFILLPPGMPNPDCKGWTGLQAEYEPALLEMAQNTPGCAFLPITRMHDYIVGIKGYANICGNGVNHPNDFMVRVYASAITECLIQ